MRISDWSSDVCSSDLAGNAGSGPSGIAKLLEAGRCNEVGERYDAERGAGTVGIGSDDFAVFADRNTGVVAGIGGVDRIGADRRNLNGGQGRRVEGDRKSVV